MDDKEILSRFVLIALATVLTLHVMQDFFGYDPLAIPFLNGQFVQIDSWSLVHVITFILCGYYQPGHLKTFMATGIIWEGVEYLLSAGWDHNFWAELSMNIFWDLWFNLAGYRLGEFIAFATGRAVPVTKEEWEKGTTNSSREGSSSAQKKKKKKKKNKGS